MIELASDALLRPRLDAAEFDKVRELAVQSIAAAKDSDPRALVGSYGDALAVPRPPVRSSGRWQRGVAGRRDARRRARLLRRAGARRPADHRGRRRLRAGRHAAPAASRPSARCRGAAASPPVAPVAQRGQGRRVLLVDKPGATQTYFWLGNVGASRTDPGAHRAGRGQHRVRRPLHLDAEHRAARQERAQLRRRLRLRRAPRSRARSGSRRSRRPSTTVPGHRPRARDARPPAPGRRSTTRRSTPRGATCSASSRRRIETNGALAARLDRPRSCTASAARTSTGSRPGSRRSMVRRRARRSTRRSRSPADLAMVLIGDAARIRDDVRKYGPVTEMKITDPRFAPATHEAAAPRSWPGRRASSAANACAACSPRRATSGSSW